MPEARGFISSKMGVDSISVCYGIGLVGDYDGRSMCWHKTSSYNIFSGVVHLSFVISHFLYSRRWSQLAHFFLVISYFF